MSESQAHALLRRLAAGDQKALGEFYDLFASLANGLALRILRDASDAEDVVQESFVQVWRQAGRYDPRRGSPQAWLCTIARTRALDRLRRRVSRREDATDAPPATTDAPQTEEAMTVRKALDGLSTDQRRALELAYYQGLTQTEIARELGEPLGTIKTRIRTAMIRLREALGPGGLVSDERLMEMAPLYALGALDGDELAEFGRSLSASPSLQAEVSAFEAVIGRLAFLHAAAAPSQRLRARTLGAAGFFPAPASAPLARRDPVSRPSWLAWAAVLAAVAIGAAWAWEHARLGVALREAASLREERDTLAADVQQARLQLAAVQEQLGREVAFRELVAHRESRQTLLAGLAPAPGAVARVVWNPDTREAVLLAAGLQPAPAGKVYEAWVIAGGAPVPAGTFQVDAGGKAVLRLPTVDETRSVKTFAVTIEPAGGTAAPTGPMVLAGAV